VSDSLNCRTCKAHGDAMCVCPVLIRRTDTPDAAEFWRRAERDEADQSKFQPGQRVRKPKGYRFDATILAVFKNLSGEWRVVAENGDGLLHIFNESQLEDADG
jgi:hypothetical protein